MTHVIVHAGFHKTGTTSLQDFFSRNREALKPYLSYYGKEDFLNAGSAARIYAQRPFPHRLYSFRRRFRRFLNDTPDASVIVLSRETFSGGMPGHRRISGRLMTSYHEPASKLARVILSELRRRFGKQVDVTFFYTTREREDWIRSVHGHLLRSIRMTDDFETFRARFPELASPEEEVRRMAKALAPVPVKSAALEEFADHPFAQAAALLELACVPEKKRASLTRANRSNTGQGKELRARFLELNRSDLSRTELKRAKEALLNQVQSHQQIS